MDRWLDPHTSETGRALLRRFCGLEAFALDCRRCQDRTVIYLGKGSGGKGSGGGGRKADFVLAPPTFEKRALKTRLPAKVKTVLGFGPGL